jgi:hypothetical protein
MTNTRCWFFAIGALLGTLVSPPTAAEPENTKEQLDRARKVVDEAAEEAKKEGEGETSEQMSPDNPHYAAGYLFIGEDYHEGRSSKAEVEARVAKMDENRNWRRKEQLGGILGLWGARILNHPGAREELRVHARRQARIARALFLAHTDPSVKDRAALIARIQSIIDAEDVRHEKAMRALDSAPPAAGGK